MSLNTDLGMKVRELAHVGKKHHRDTDKTISSAHRRLGRLPVPIAHVVRSLRSRAEIEENKRNRGKQWDEKD